MIRIGIPRIEQRGNVVYMIAHVSDEVQMIDSDIYYSTCVEYGKYLSYEVSDAFVLGCLLPSVLYGEDIVVEGPVSEKLYYNLTNSVLYLLSLIYKNRIKIHANNLVSSKYDATGVGCGCSLGIDSFAAMLQHLPPLSGEQCCITNSYQITHLTYFNVGAMGYVDLVKAKESYDKDIKMVESFAQEVGLPVVRLESNFSILYKDFDFDESGVFRNFSAVLSLQKLFGKYLYGSSFPISAFKFEKKDVGYYESLLAPLVSTETTEIVIVNQDMTRVEKTRYIVNSTLAHRYLYVCWKEVIANKWPESEIARVKDLYLNCSRCDKCKRTLLAMDLLGELSKFKSVFDIPYWEGVKDKYIAKVVFEKDNNTFYKELYELMQDKNYQLTKETKLELCRLYFHNSFCYRFLKRIKRIIKQ